MSPVAVLPGTSISEAKDHLSKVVDEAVHRHRPQLIQRHGESEAMLIGVEQARELLRSFVFEPRVVFADDEVVISLDRHGLVVSGRSMNDAADAMVSELRDHSKDFLARYEFFRHTPRNQELPWLLRFALTPEEQQRELLFEEPSDESHHTRIEDVAVSR